MRGLGWTISYHAGVRVGMNPTPTNPPCTSNVGVFFIPIKAKENNVVIKCTSNVGFFFIPIKAKENNVVIKCTSNVGVGFIPTLTPQNI